MDGHLVAVEVGVERRAGQRVQLDRLAFDEDGLERLDAEPVQRGGAVQEDRVVLGDELEDVPDLRAHLLEHALGGLEREALGLHELADDERPEQLERHLLGETALVELEVRADDDDGAAGVVHALTEQVLAEAALLALQDVGQGLERPVAGADDDAAARAVLEQRVDGFLEQALLVEDHDFGRAQRLDVLQAVVAVDDAAIQIVQVGRREAAALERHERAELRRDHGQAWSGSSTPARCRTR